MALRGLLCAVLAMVVCVLAAPPASGEVISVNFIGAGPFGATYPVGDLRAGCVPVTGWNDYNVRHLGGMDLTDSDGFATAAFLAHTNGNADYNGTVDMNGIPSGDHYLMRGHGEALEGGMPLALTLSGLGDAFSPHGYALYVYADAGATDSRPYTYSISAGGETVETVAMTDPGGTFWDGTFDFVTPDDPAGNVILFERLTAGNFTLTTDGPVNGFQIVRAPEPTTIALLAAGGVALLVRRRRRYH